MAGSWNFVFGCPRVGPTPPLPWWGWRLFPQNLSARLAHPSSPYLAWYLASPAQLLIGLVGRLLSWAHENKKEHSIETLKHL